MGKDEEPRSGEQAPAEDNDKAKHSEKTEAVSNVATNETAEEEKTKKKKVGLGPRPEHFNSTFTEILFVLTCTAAIMSGSFFTGILTVISNIIADDLRMTQAQISWLTASITLAGGPTLLFFGRLADLFGRKKLFVGSFFCFSVFTLGASFSKNAITIDTLNGFIGLSSAAMVTPAAGALGYLYEKPSKRKNYAFACYAAGNPIGFVLGTLFGALATQIFNWEASYRLISIVYILFTIIALFTMPKDESEKEPLGLAAIKKFDIVGTILAMGGIGMLTTALTLGGESNSGWKTPEVLVLLIVGILLIVAFVFWEQRFKHPLVPMWIWKDRDFSLLVAILLLGFMAFTTSSFWIALFYQREGHSPLKVALYLLPMVIVGLSVNVVAGAVLHRVSNKLLMIIGTLAYLISFLLLAVQRAGDSYFAFTFPSLVIVTLGADFQFNVVNMYVMTTLPRTQQSIAGGIFQTVSRLCTTIGFGLTTAIYNGIAEAPPRHGYYGNNAIAPYAGTFWFSFGCAAVSMIMVPFLRIGTQGHVTTDEEGQKDKTDTNSAASNDATEKETSKDDSNEKAVGEDEESDTTPTEARDKEKS